MPGSNDPEFLAAQQALARYYTVERELGRGGMGVVYLGRDVRLERLVAIKVLPPRLAADAELRERFLREARTAAKLSHPNIVPVFRAGESDGHAFFVMEYVDGESLAERVRARGALPPAEVVVYLREVAWALAYAHARGVVHRDVKPENIMIERTPNRSPWDPAGIAGRALVTDFGIAGGALINQGPTRLTREGQILGTVHYMSPEQVNGDPLDGRSDLYSLGVVGYFALSGGRLPFEGETVPPIMLAHATKPPPPLNGVAPNVPREIAAVIDRCLAKDPAARFPTGEALAEELGRAMAAADLAAASSGAGDFAVLSDAQAAAVWRRAAQLQAEAARRLEERARHPELGALGPPGAPADGLRLRDVESAAAEVGISRQFVALAVAEIGAAARGEPGAVAPKELAEWQEVAATYVLGFSDRSVTASRVVRAPPRRVLQAIGRVLRAPPFSLALRDAPGRHPLDGGVLVFDLPESGAAAALGRHPWRHTRHGVYARQVQMTLHALPNDPNACEVQLHADVRQGLRTTVVSTAMMSGFLGGVLGTSGVLVGIDALALAGAALALPAAAGLAIGIGGSLVGLRAAYRHQLRRTVAELEAALAAVEASIRTEEIFEG